MTPVKVNECVFVPKRKSAMLILGPPCSGKGELCRHFNDPSITHYSASTELIKYSKYYDPQILKDMNQGMLIALETMKKIGRWSINDFHCHRQLGFFDGFGRREAELEYFISLMKNSKFDVDFRVVILDASEEILIDRCNIRQAKKEENRNDHHMIKDRIKFFVKEKESLLRVLDRRRIAFKNIYTDALTPNQVCCETLRFLGVPVVEKV